MASAVVRTTSSEPARLRRGLAADGVSVHVACDTRDVARLVARHGSSVVVLATTTPVTDVQAVLRACAQGCVAAPVIVVSGVADTATKVASLDAGASDFLADPFEMTELVARVRVQSRAIDRVAVPERLLAGPLVLDVALRTVQVRGRPVNLTGREFLLLRHLMRTPDAVCTRAELLAEVWGYDFDPGTNVIDACITRLRAKLTPHAITTVRNVGYRLRVA